MKSLTQKLALSVLALVLTGVALATGVYAWFAVNNTTKVENLSGTAEAASGGFMMASKQGSGAWSDWTTAVDLSTITVTGSQTLSAVTYDGSKLVSWDSATHTQNTDEATQGYIEFQLAIAAGQGFNSIEIASLTLESTATYWSQTKGSGADENDSDAYTGFISNAVRVGFFGGVTSAVIFEQNTATNANTSGFDTGAEDKAVDLYNKVAGASISAPTAPYAAIAASTALNNEIASLTTTKPAELTAPAEEYTKFQIVTVKVWIEGWDAEAFNEIMGGTFTLNMSFKAIA